MYRQHEPPRPIHEPVDHHGPLQTAEEEVRQWRHYIELLQGKLVPGEEHRRHDLLAASREQADAAIRADDDWMRMNNLTIVEREHAVEGRVLVAKHECAAAAGKIRELQDRLGRDESKVVGVRRRDKFVGMFSSSSKERRFQLHEKHKRKLLLVRQDIGNVMGVRQYQDDLVAGYEHLLSTLRTVLVRNQEEVYDAPPPNYDARPDRPPSRHREERAAPPSHRIPRRTRSQRPDTTYSLIPIDIGDFYDDHGDELGHEAIPIHHAPGAALDEPHGQHASPQHHHSAHAAHYNPELERRPTVRSTARQSRLSWVPSSPISSDGLLSPVERNAPFPWDDLEDEPIRPESSASRYHPGSRSTSPHGAQHHHAPHPHPHQGHAVHSTRPSRRPAPGDLRLVTSVGGGRPLATHRESHESLHATNAAHNFDHLPDVSAIRLDAMSPETAHPER